MGNHELQPNMDHSDVNELAQPLGNLLQAAFQVVFDRRRIGRGQLDG